MWVAYLKDYSIEDMGDVIIYIENTVTGIKREIDVGLRRSGEPGDKSWQPSDRTLESFGLTRKEWEDNILQFCDWLGKELPVQEKYNIRTFDYCFEDQLSLEAAGAMVTAFNNQQLR